MTPDQFTASSIAVLRSSVGWQTHIAKKLGVNLRTVTRWLTGGGTPPWVDAKFAEWTGHDAIRPWPRDEWMIGDTTGGDGRTREYIAHLQPPRFVARIVACDDGAPLPEEMPADVVTGSIYSSGDAMICEIEWIDEVVPGEVVKWLEAAADEIDRQS